MDRKSKTDSFELLDKCSKTVLDWFTHNGLSLNPAKTEILIMGTRQCVETIRPDSKVKVAGCDIEPSESIRSLGVTLDNTLSFDKHVGAVCKSASFHIRALRHIRPTLTTVHRYGQKCWKCDSRFQTGLLQQFAPWNLN